MICFSCRAAADVIAIMHDNPEKTTGAFDYLGRDCVAVSKFLHKVCKGCDCQHRISDFPKESAGTQQPPGESKNDTAVQLELPL